MPVAFSESLAFGQVGESRIALWLRARGSMVLPVYEKELDTGKGPRLFLPVDDQLVAPDMLVFSGNGAWWIEAKHKTAFTLHRKTGDFVTGIDLRHYRDYCRVDDETPWPVWLLFLHAGGRASGAGQPERSPSGLFGASLGLLRENEHHTWADYGSGGMVYWASPPLQRLASIEEIEKLAAAV